MNANSLRESKHKYPIEICKTKKTGEFHKVSKRQAASKHLYSLKVNVDTYFIDDKFNCIDKLMANGKWKINGKQTIIRVSLELNMSRLCKNFSNDQNLIAQMQL